MRISYSTKFIKQYRKLSNEMKRLAEDKETIFKADPFDRRLKTHKLHGKFAGFLSFSIHFNRRIIFDFEKDGKNVRFHTIGTHDVYE